MDLTTRTPKPQVAGSSPAAPATLPAHNEGVRGLYTGTPLLVVTAVLVTKWSRISSDRISQHVVNAPSSRFFQPRHNVRIRIDCKGDGGVSQGRLDDGRVDIEIPALAQERMEELREQSQQ